MHYQELVTYLKHLKSLHGARAAKAHPSQGVASKAQGTLWEEVARPNQRLPEGDWRLWLILAGRGFGKTRTGAESVKCLVERFGYRRIALIGASIVQVQSIMLEGESGLLSLYEPHERPKFERTTRTLRFNNGAIATLFGAEHADHLRGPQFDLAWVDELAKFRHPRRLVEQLWLSLRLGVPRCIITTTPRPLKLLHDWCAQPQKYKAVITRGTTFDNKAHLAPAFLEAIAKEFDHTKIGAQELYGEILSEEDGALWQRASIHYEQAPSLPSKSSLVRIVIAIDPATTHHEGSDETGIVVAGVDHQNKAYVLEDLSGKFSPLDWGQRVVDAYHRHKADRIVAEVNKGGDLVESVVRALDAHVAYKEVRATRGKTLRAEPIAALYERGRVAHVRPFHKLEDQMCTFIQGRTQKSPDRVDALVWALTELMLEGEGQARLKVWGA